MWKVGCQDSVLHFTGHELVVTGLTLNQGTSGFCILHDSCVIDRDIFNEMKLINIKQFAKYCPFISAEYPCFDCGCNLVCLLHLQKKILSCVQGLGITR